MCVCLLLIQSGSQSEVLLSDVIRYNNKVAGLSDSYRSVHADNGSTWKRGTIYSRLDYIFVSNAILSKISGDTIDWAFESLLRLLLLLRRNP